MLSMRFPCPPSQQKSSPSIPYGRHDLHKRSVSITVASGSGGQDHTAENVVDLQPRDQRRQRWLPEGLRRDLMPKHVAVILDGNRRWGRQRGLPLDVTHRSGARRMIELTTLCRKWGVKVLTVFAFSTENWARPQEEVDILMNLFEEVMVTELAEARKRGVRVSIIGDTSKLPNVLQKLISETEEATKANSRLHLIVAINYGGQHDITQACRKVAKKVKEGLIQLEDINNSLIQQELLTNCTEYPNPDLLIRSSGELRVSNFMLWQLAYTELYFVNKLWPDFEEADFTEALMSFQERQRRPISS